MKLSISNIGWDASYDNKIYGIMNEYGYSGLEIAPTRIFPEAPYEKLVEAKLWSDKLREKYGLVIPSMQSIWYGRQEKLFGTSEEREILVEYTKKAIDFAAAIGCKNLVFGCPKNRNIPKDGSVESAIPFFREVGDYAASVGTAIGMEANPKIYNTNYINETEEAIALIKQVGSKGFLLNLDLGTMIQNEESISKLVGNVKYINHVHISEPGLKPIENRTLHKEIFELLKNESYDGFISIEMGKMEDIAIIADRMCYIRESFE